MEEKSKKCTLNVFVYAYELIYIYEWIGKMCKTSKHKKKYEQMMLLRL